MALVRAAVGAGRRALAPHCSCLANGSELRVRCFSSWLHHNHKEAEFRRSTVMWRFGSRRFYADMPSHQPIGMPSLSPTMSQGNIVRWKKKEGDKIAAGEVLCEIETDKATVDMESMEDGYLAKIVFADGSKDVKVGQTIAITVEEQGDVDKFKDYKPSEAPAAAPKESPSPPPKQESPRPSPSSSPSPSPSPRPASGDRVIASPNARKYAQDNQISLSGVSGTGPGGRIVRADVEGLSGQQVQQQPPRAAEQPGVSTSLDYTDMPNTQIRRVIAQRLLQSKQTIPHYYLTVDVRVDKLLALRTQLNSKLEKDKRKKLSVNDFVLKAAALALKKVPECNSSWTDEFIRQFHNVNISVAVQTERGLMVPVVKDADKKGLGTISDDVRTLAEKARENTLKPSDYDGGTFTVSNLGGPFGIKQGLSMVRLERTGLVHSRATSKTP